MPPKRRRRFQGLYYHSSPPKVMPMNGQTGGQNGGKRRDNDDFSVKLSTIRIWMHEKDIGKLTRILWAGQGHRLCQQASNNGRVKRFLSAVPHVMNAIKDLHQAVIDNNLETLQVQLEPPVPAALVTCKDGNGLNVIHKAAGLGHTKILEYLVSIWPEGAHETDITGKTPLHWAASAKNNMRCYTLLTQAGCDEEALDYKMKTPSYYRHKPHEIERAFLVYVPEAPRVSPDSVTDWEALSEEGGGDLSAAGDSASKKLDLKIPLTTNGGRKSSADSLENTSELDATEEGISANEEEELLSKTETEPKLRRPETPFGQDDQVEAEETETENITRAVSSAAAEQMENGTDVAETESTEELQSVEKEEKLVEAEAVAETEMETAETEQQVKSEEELVDNEKTEQTEKVTEKEEEEVDELINNNNDEEVPKPEENNEELDDKEEDNDDDDDEVQMGLL